MPLRFDHAVILVNDLQIALKDYHTLGFNAFYGGKHADGKTHNALIVFQDGAYLELLAPTNPDLLKTVDADNRASFLFMFQYGEGFGGYALLATDLDAEMQAMQKRGLEIQARSPGGRARPDGQQLRWRSATLGGSMTPFFIQDDTPRVLRVPDDTEKTTQPNGATGVAGIGVQVADLKTGIQRYQTILDTAPTEQTNSTALFTLDTLRVALAEAPSPHGDKLRSIKLVAAEDRLLSTSLTHNAPIELVKNEAH